MVGRAMGEPIAHNAPGPFFFLPNRFLPLIVIITSVIRTQRDAVIITKRALVRVTRMRRTNYRYTDY